MNSLITYLTAAGLFVQPRGESLYSIVKPIQTKGNAITGMRSKPFVNPLGEESEATLLETDAPLLGIEFRDGNWMVSVWQWVPGPGPGDFEREYDTASEAVNKVMQYFFGADPDFEAFRKYKENESR